MAEASNTENDSIKKEGAVCVVGGGIGGVQAALDLADSGYFVYVVEQSSAIGGVMSMLDKTFPTNDCSMCILSPKLVECARHRNIQILTNSTVTGLDGSAGNFSVTVTMKPRYIDMELCVACGLCAEKCPKKVPNEFDCGLSKRKSAHVKYPQAVPLKYLIDSENCIYLNKGKCRACEKACPKGAINFDQEPTEKKLDVGAVILSNGFEVFDAGIKGEFGYGWLPNVVTSLEFERILSASGPYGGHIQRPSDGKEPEKIAFIQCVGSRDQSCGNTYCSSVCCMYATKEAVIAKEHLSSVEPTIFYMDMRAFGKDFDKYIDRAKDEHGVRYIRCMVSAVKLIPETEQLFVKYRTEDGTPQEEVFDMVVLSVGLTAGKNAAEMAEIMGIELNEHGFAKTDPTNPLKTSKDGVYVCGAFSGPKDIPETVMQASGASAIAQSILSEARGSKTVSAPQIHEMDLRGIPPRIGVFVCNCGINIGGVVKVPEVVEYARTLPNVAFADEALFTCSQDTQEIIKEKIKEHNLTRLIVAACSPRTHEPLFQETCGEAGLNPYMFEMANIRDQCSWVHQKNPEGATEKAKDLVKMAVAKSATLTPLSQSHLSVNKDALVIGGGLAGMTSALSLADQGFKVFLIEKSNDLGGNYKQLYYTLEGVDTQKNLNAIVERVRNHPDIEVFTGARIKDIKGFVGNFKTIFSAQGEEREIEHGVVIVAIGAREIETKEYLYVRHKAVLTQRELEEKIATDPDSLKDLNQVVMIQCVGSRNAERPYCSRYCCSEAVKNAIKIKESNPQTQVFVLYRDVRTYGFREDYYLKARDLGVIFLRYEENEPPNVVTDDDGNLRLSVEDRILHRELILTPDILALSVGTEYPADAEDLAQMLKIPTNAEHFFLEAHMKLRPVDFATEGVFICGLAHFPKFSEEAVSQAYAAASRAATVLTKDFIESEAKIAFVNEARCAGCGLCEANCPYGAITVNVERRVAEVNAALCKGCGVCTASCRMNAVDLSGFTNQQILSALEALRD